MQRTLWALRVFLIVFLSEAVCATLYGVINDASGTTVTLVQIDPQTTKYQTVCTLKSTPLFSGASSGDSNRNLLFFYTHATPTSKPQLVTVNPRTCKVLTRTISGLGSGQFLVYDVKYNPGSDSLYMLFPNPNCIHGTLDHISLTNLTNADATRLNDVIDGQGLSQMTGIDWKNGLYYYIAFSMGDPNNVAAQMQQQQQQPIKTNQNVKRRFGFFINQLNLTTGLISQHVLVDNSLRLGQTFNYTMNVYNNVKQSSIQIIGAVTPPAGTPGTDCLPSGFFTVDYATGKVACLTDTTNSYTVYPLSEIDSTLGHYYQVFVDYSTNTHYFSVLDIASQKLVSTTPCAVCSKLATLTLLQD